MVHFGAFFDLKVPDSLFYRILKYLTKNYNFSCFFTNNVKCFSTYIVKCFNAYTVFILFINCIIFSIVLKTNKITLKNCLKMAQISF